MATNPDTHAAAAGDTLPKSSAGGPSVVRGDRSHPAPEDNTLPRYSASGQPVTRADRIAFQIWLLCVLLTVAITLALFLFDKIYFAVTGR